MTLDMQVLEQEVESERPLGMRAQAIRRLRRDPVSIFAFSVLVFLALGGHHRRPTRRPSHGTLAERAVRNGARLRRATHRDHATGLRVLNGVTHNPHGTLFILGADSLGRDLLVRVLYGARISLLVATGATALALIIGISLGLLAGYLGGWVDGVVNRLTETAMAFPNLLLAVGIAVVIGPGILNVVIIIALFTWYYPCRIVRSATAATKQMTYVAAARTMGARPRRILLVHLLPQVWGPLLVYATSIIANNILFEAGLSYLGVGVPAPTASWGSMLSDAVQSSMYTVDLPLALVPGLALLVTMLAFNLLGDGLRDALDPKAGR